MFELRKRRIIDLVLMPDGIHIKGQNFVGLFVLRSRQGNCRLLLQPKVSAKSLLEIMLYTVEGINLRQAQNIVAGIGLEEEVKVIDILALALIRRFISKLSEALVWGFLVSEEEQRVVSSTLKGRLLTSESINVMGSMGLPVLVSSFRNYTYDNPINALIKVGCQKLFERRWRALVNKRDLGVLSSALLELWYVDKIDVSSLHQLDVHQLLLDIPFERQYLHNLVSLAYTILSYVRLGELIEVPSVYMNMDAIFEGFARRLFADAARTHNVIVRKAGKGDEVYLTDEPTRIHGLRPDILLLKGQNLLAVADVKYTLEKPEDDKESHNQIFTYMMRWGTQHAVLIFPASENDKEGASTYLIKSDREEKYLHLMRINLQTIDSSFACVQSLVKKIINASVSSA